MFSYLRRIWTGQFRLFVRLLVRYFYLVCYIVISKIFPIMSINWTRIHISPTHQFKIFCMSWKENSIFNLRSVWTVFQIELCVLLVQFLVYHEVQRVRREKKKQTLIEERHATSGSSKNSLAHLEAIAFQFVSCMRLFSKIVFSSPSNIFHFR